MAAPCYNGPNPIKDEDRFAIWSWAKENGIDRGDPIDNVSRAINQKFFGGQAKPEWINDILSGRKTPFKAVATDMWIKQYNRRVVTQKAGDLSQFANMTPLGKFVRALWTGPRTLTVAGHGIVFPVTHAGDLIMRPASWGTFIKGTLRTYRAAAPDLFGIASKLGGGKAYEARMLNALKTDSMYDLGLQSGVDMGENSHPSGLITRNYQGPAQRAWNGLTVMRFELWKKQMAKFVEPGMSHADVLDIGKNLADWANNATGSGKGFLAGKEGAATLFGPKLTQSKLNRITVDPIKTVKTFKNWDVATVGERAVAQTRLSGSVQFMLAQGGFLAVNAGLLYALGSKQKINFTDPTKGDFWQFKGGGFTGNVPGLHSELKAVANVLAASFASKTPFKWMPAPIAQFQQEQAKALKGDTKAAAIAKTLGYYATGKLTPSIQRIKEGLTGQDYMGHPLPFSSEQGTVKKQPLTWGQYLADVGPIPTSGPTGYVLDELQKGGMAKADALSVTKAFIFQGLTDPKTWELLGAGLPGFHVRPDYQLEKQQSAGGGLTREVTTQAGTTREILTR